MKLWISFTKTDDVIWSYISLGLKTQSILKLISLIHDGKCMTHTTSGYLSDCCFDFYLFLFLFLMSCPISWCNTNCLKFILRLAGTAQSLFRSGNDSQFNEKLTVGWRWNANCGVLYQSQMLCMPNTPRPPTSDMLQQHTRHLSGKR